MRNYRELMDNDPIVGAILFASNHLCRKVSFNFKPANESNEAKKVADFVGGAIFDDMETSWPDTMSEILTMLPFGWALIEMRMKKRLGYGPVDFSLPDTLGNNTPNNVGIPAPEFSPSRFDDGKIGFRSWGLRSQETLFQWEFDEDSNPTVMQQMAPPDYRIRRVPMSKCLHFRTQVSKGNPEGRSMLRNAWPSYYMKKNLQVFEGIGIERDLAGYPMIQIVPPDASKAQMVPDIWNPNDVNMVNMLSEMKRIVRSVRRDEQEGIVMPWWAEFKLLSTGSRRSFDTNSIIGRYDQRIAMSMMADFIMLGHEAVGSKALAATKISLFTAALSSFIDNVCAIIDRKAVPTLLRYNGIPLDLSPTLQHGDVESINIQELGEFISKIAGTGFNPLASVEAQKAIMEAAKLPSEGVDGTLTLPLPGAAGKVSAPVKPQGKPGEKDLEVVGDNTSGRNRRSGPVMPEETTTGTPDVLTTT
jgi:hypothetical protein